LDFIPPTPSNPNSSVLYYNQTAGIMSADFQSMRVYSNKDSGSIVYGTEVSDNRYIF